ncbi:hypothetical protein ACIRYZ_21810 [Kitasatospora sp. NPDC101155]|uniref:hypothetical protein n=1 Tax=Kitasatospora sp. NPDC101155 TaxID=3364097 RepID=UPI003812B313
MTKPRLTQQEHIELGRVLAGIQDEILRRRVRLLNAYPRTGPEAVPAAKLKAAIQALREARDELENAVFREHPATASTGDYFPGEEDRAVIVSPRRS